MRMIFGAAVGFAIVMSAAPAMAANPEDGALNSVYDRLASARAANDVPGMASAFAPGGILVDSRPGPAIGGGELAAVLQPQAQRIATDGVKMETLYRVERRSVMGTMAIDAGFMRVSMARPGAEPMVRYARFLVTMRREADGSWRIVGDASMPATKEAWDGVAAGDGRKHDG